MHTVKKEPTHREDRSGGCACQAPGQQRRILQERVGVALFVRGGAAVAAEVRHQGRRAHGGRRREHYVQSRGVEEGAERSQLRLGMVQCGLLVGRPRRVRSDAQLLRRTNPRRDSQVEVRGGKIGTLRGHRRQQRQRTGQRQASVSSRCSKPPCSRRVSHPIGICCPGSNRPMSTSPATNPAVPSAAGRCVRDRVARGDRSPRRTP